MNVVVASLAEVVRRHPLVSFFVLAYGIAWVFLPASSFGAFGPLVAALVVVPVLRGRAGLRELGARLVRWRVSWFWWVLAVGVPLVVHLVNAFAHGRSVAPGSDALTAFLLTFALRLVNPTDGPLAEEPGFRGFALPTLQGSGWSPLTATAILAGLVAGWHLPLFFLEEGGVSPSVLVTGLLTTAAVTFWYSWLFNRTGGSVLLTLVAHSVEGSIRTPVDWTYTTVWCLVAMALVVFDRRAWRRSPDQEPAWARLDGTPPQAARGARA